MITLDRFVEGCLCHTKDELFKIVRKQEDRDILSQAAELAMDKMPELTENMKVKLPVVKEFLQGKRESILEFITWNKYPHVGTPDEIDYINTCCVYHGIIRKIIEDNFPHTNKTKRSKK